mgnify:CR=1 FL=1
MIGGFCSVCYYVQNGPNDELEILFQFLRYWGLSCISNMHNIFIFDDRRNLC